MSLAKEIIEIDPSGCLEPHSPCTSGTSSTKRPEREAPAFQQVSEDIIQKIKPEASAPEVFHQIFKTCSCVLAAKEIANIPDRAELIILSSLLRIAKDTECLIYLLEFLISPLFLARVTVRVVLHRQLAIRLLYLIGSGIFS